MNRWLPASGFANLAHISERKARLALERAHRGAKPWRGAEISVRLVPSLGGPAGVRYEVLVDSLPADIQEAWKGLQSDCETAPLLRDDRPNVASWRLHIISPAVPHAKGTAARAEAIRKIVAETRVGPDGRQIRITDRTVQRWLDAYKAEGINGLKLRARKDKGARRVVISQPWFEKARVWFDTATIAQIDADLRAFIRSKYTANESPGRIIFRAGQELQRLSAENGMPVAEMGKPVFAVPRSYVVEQKVFGKSATRDHDAKAYHDMRPAALRSLAPLPTQFDLDAMHFDHVLRREDGSEAYPKAIVAACRATHRLFVKAFLLEKGEGIRQEHVALFIEELFDRWGVPERLTIDNGGEFRAVRDLTDILQLVGQVSSIDGRKPIVNAQPYNARAKVVENTIGVLQRVWLSSLPGHVGNNRINRKTQQVGRPTAPFPGDFDLFARLADMRVQEYNEAPQRGKLKGRSPNEVYQAHIDDGFTIAKVDRASLIIAFSKRDVASVGKFGIRVSGQWWTCDELHYRSGEKIGILKGRFHNWPAVPLFDLDNERAIIGYAKPNVAIDGTDPANAREQKRRERLFNSRTRELKQAAPPADPIADTIAAAAMLAPAPEAPVSGTIVPNQQAAEIVAAMRETPEEHQSRRARKVHNDIAAELAKSDKFARLLLRDKR